MLKWCGGLDGTSGDFPGFHGTQAGFVPMPSMAAGGNGQSGG